LRTLIVNADDFGFTHDVNRGIVEAHTRGILTATTLMANGAAFDDAVRLAKEHATLDIGCHLVLIGGNSLLRAGASLPSTVKDLIVAVCRRSISPYDELKTQVERILHTGLQPTHLDTHKHTHLLPPVLDAVARLAEEYGIRWVRRPFDLPLSGDTTQVPLTLRWVSKSMGMLRAGFHNRLTRHRCRTTDHFAGFQLTGRFRSEQLSALLRSLPEGTTEFMCHPGRCTEELQRARTRLKETREMELLALVDPRIRELVVTEQIRLATYRELGG
jgi:predicted glycoside hydrolase/deacetylase ChbG (UPF0249 family)